MKKYILVFSLFLLPLWGGRVGFLYSIEKVESPSLNLAAYFDVQDGRPVYWLLHKGDTVIRPSHLGLALRGEHSRGDFNDYKEESNSPQDGLSAAGGLTSNSVSGLLNGFVMTGSSYAHGLISVPDYVDYILSPSEWHDPDLCWNLSIPHPNDRMLHIGFPSDDNIINSSADECSRIRQTRYSKYVLWMPTLRSNSMSRNDSTDEMPFGIPLVKTREQLERIDSFCREHDCLLIIKIHPMQRKETYQGLTDMGHIAVLDGDKVKALGIDNYRLMKNCDAMMSDFSSSTFSFLMLNRPVAFDFSDLEYYKHAMPDEIINAYTPGMKVYSIDDFIAFLRSVCDGEDEYREERSEFVEKLYTYRDGNACRRLAEFVGMIPKE